MGAAPRALRLVQPSEPALLKRFCGHCGRSPESEPEREPASRVCAHCGLGLMLEASADVAPTAEDPFIVIDHAMSLSAVSRKAEKFLGVSEPAAVGRHLKEFLVPADTDIPAAQSFFALVMLAAAGGSEPRTVAVRPADLFGVRYWARVATCGPSNAALLLLVTMD